MGCEDGGNFFFGAAVEDFDFGVAFSEVDRCDDSFDIGVWFAADPDVDPSSIDGSCVFQFSVVERVNHVWVTGMSGAFGSVDVDFGVGD